MPYGLIGALVAIAFVAGGLAGAVAGLLVDSSGDSNGGAGSDRRVAAEDGSAVQAVAGALPGVVIVVNEIAPKGNEPGGLGAGAGFVADERGFIVTNEHIVHDPGKLTVVLSNGERRSATVVSTDAPYTDLAVLRVQPGGLKAVPIGSSQDLRQGETVIAIGSPDFDYNNTVTAGVVSGLERRKLLQGVYLDDLIQTDAAINLGNSGGPLINLRGQVVGVVTFRDVGGDDDLTGISFAISSRTFKPIVESMISKGAFPRPYFGIDHQNGSRGALVQRVFDSSPAEKAGIKAGDIIIRIGRNEVNQELPFLNALALAGTSGRVSVQVLRDGRTLDLTLELAAR
ncbi:MAG TPA: trypsin-like peptidase domain-containing protein [Dehalococcoidia bacterium]|nr:trypsin-like peptidase domain-containing protein [Dehalococcoidia bacterium]